MEFRPLTGRAVEPDAAAVHLDDLARDGQTEAGPATAVRVTAREQPIVEVVRHPRAVILHGHGHLLGVRLAGHHDLSALARELDRVADQVCQDLGDLFAVTRHRRGGIVEPGGPLAMLNAIPFYRKQRAHRGDIGNFTTVGLCHLRPRG